MAQTISVDAKILDKILTRLDALARDVSELKKNLLDEEPQYGSDEWWKWSDKKALEDYKKGDYYELKDKKELDNFFNNIHSDVSNEEYHHKVRR